jgi:rubrerythrin
LKSPGKHIRGFTPKIKFKEIIMRIFSAVLLSAAFAFTALAPGAWADSAPSGTVQAQATARPTPPAKHHASKKSRKSRKAKGTKVVWVCPMGDYVGTKPGKCPNCGMELVKEVVKADWTPSPSSDSGKK